MKERALVAAIVAAMLVLLALVFGIAYFFAGAIE